MAPVGEQAPPAFLGRERLAADVADHLGIGPHRRDFGEIGRRVGAQDQAGGGERRHVIGVLSPVRGACD